MLHSASKTAGFVQQGQRKPKWPICRISMPQKAPSRRPHRLLRQTQTAVLPGGLDQLVVDSTLPVLKMGMVCAAGAMSAHFVSIKHDHASFHRLQQLLLPTQHSHQHHTRTTHTLAVAHLPASPAGHAERRSSQGPQQASYQCVHTSSHDYEAGCTHRPCLSTQPVVHWGQCHLMVGAACRRSCAGMAFSCHHTFVSSCMLMQLLLMAQCSQARYAVSTSMSPAHLSQPLLLHLCSLAVQAYVPLSCSHFVGLGLGVLHTRLLPTPPNLKHIIQVSSSIANTGNLPLVLVLSLIKSPNLPFNTAAQAELAVSYIMLGWWYATLVQMPLGESSWRRGGAEFVANIM